MALSIDNDIRLLTQDQHNYTIAEETATLLMGGS
jgi:hypothetical protein